MIKRTFECAAGHITEPFVHADDDLEKMKKEGKLLCMDCGVRIEKIYPPQTNVIGGTSREKELPMSPAQLRAALVELRRQVESNCDYVGPLFAEEARKIHYGESDPHAIYGEASEAETRELAEEGIQFGRIPWVKLDS